MKISNVEPKFGARIFEFSRIINKMNGHRIFIYIYVRGRSVTPSEKFRCNASPLYYIIRIMKYIIDYFLPNDVLY